MAQHKRAGTHPQPESPPVEAGPKRPARRQDSPPEAILLLSGGIDSSTMLADALAETGKHAAIAVEALFIDYGQTAADQEARAATQIAIHYGVPLFITDAPHIERSPDGTYPGRNLLLIAIATCRAIQRGAIAILIGTTAGDGEHFADARPAFLHAARTAAGLCHGSAPILLTPYTELWKPDVIGTAKALAVPTELTWSCWENTPTPCGECRACKIRHRALHALPDSRLPQPAGA